MPLPTYTAKPRRLSVNTAHGRASPHKICMLLAVFDLARAGARPDNRILYAPPPPSPSFSSRGLWSLPAL
jgi:putative restriction endonuclease